MGLVPLLQCVAAVVGIVACLAGLAWTIHKAGRHNLLRTMGLMSFAAAGVLVLGFVLWGIIARNLNRSPPPGEVITNSIGMKLVLIPAGEFVMGSKESSEALVKEYGVETWYSGNEHPQHRVRITKSFYLGVYEVTQTQYELVMVSRPPVLQGATRPVTRVSWGNAVEFCRRLSEHEGRTYRLPTEAEWEYACRAGTRTRFYWGNGDSESVMKDYCWYRKNADSAFWTTPHASSEGTQPVGQKCPNAWGLYDMTGNVWEWCQDWYEEDYYANSPTDDPQGPSSGSSRVSRGGGWYDGAGSCRSADRYGRPRGGGNNDLGFRVALVPAE